MKIPQVVSRYILVALSIVAIFILAAANPVSAQKTVKSKLEGRVANQTVGDKPDFAYPQDVISGAEKEMKAAIATGNEGKCVDAAIRIVIAKNLISKNNAVAMASMLDSLAVSARQPYKSIYYSLEALLYEQLYRTDSYRYSQRNLPLDKFPDNPDDWSKELYSLKVTELVKKSLADSAVLKGTSISELKQILTEYDALGEKFVPNVYDLVARRGIECLSPFISNKRILPFGTGATKISVDMQASELRNEILESMVNEFTPRNNPLAYTDALKEYAAILSHNEAFEYLMSHYPELKDTEGGPILLTYAAEYLPDSFSERWMDFYREAKEVVTLQRDFPGRSSLLLTLDNMGQGSVKLEYPNKVLSDSVIKVNVETKNIAPYWVLMIKCDEATVERTHRLGEILKKCSLVDAVRVESSTDIPAISRDSIFFEGRSPGYYAFLPSTTRNLKGLITGNNGNESWVDILKISEIELLTASHNNALTGSGVGSVYVVSATNGKPIKGADVKFYYDNRKLRKSARTDSRGRVEMPEGYNEVVASYNGSRANCSSHLYPWRENKKDRKTVRTLTDLSIYHPGDSIGTAAVAFSINDNHISLLTREKVKLILLNANSEEVDSISGMTDDYGRFNGYLHIPTSGLLGIYNIAAEINGKREYSSHVNVAEYKAPTFFVEVDGVSGEIVMGEDVIINGKAMTYSGLPVSNAEVAFEINYRPVSWWDESTPNAAFAATTVTDSNGCFAISLPTSRLKGTPFFRGIFDINVSVTSPSGETAVAPMLSFSTGNGYRITVPSQLEVEVPADGNCTIPVSVIDFLGKIVDLKIDYTLSNHKGEVLLSDAFTPNSRIINLSTFPSGEYQLYLRAATRDSVATQTRLILYRADDKRPPIATQLWLTEANMYASANGKAEVKVGSSYPDSYIFCQISDSEGYYEEKWLEVSDNIVKVPVNCRKENSKTVVRFASWRDFDNKDAFVIVRPASDLNKFEIASLSFRDKITAGDKENWRFRISYADNLIPFAPAIAVMNNKALTAISPFNWHFDAKGMLSVNVNSNVTSFGCGINNSYFASPLLRSGNDYKDKAIMLPEINLYGKSLIGSLYGSSRIMYKMNCSVATADGVSNDMALEESAVEAPTAAITVRGSHNLYAGKAELAEDEAEMNGEAKGELRPVEMPVAFFKPALIADKNGELEISFEVPDFNTSWLFNLLSYDKSLNSGIITLEAVSSKPVMVQSNLPRFLRTGDVITLPATIYNNTCAPIDATAVIELFDPMDGSIVDKKDFTVRSLAAKGSEVIGIDYEVPASMSLIGYRVVCSSGNYSDGEQDVIGILPSSTPVVESFPYHLSSSLNTAEIKIPTLDKESKVTLQYCGNPIWYCVTALPAITNPDSENLFSLLPALYSNSVSSGLIEKYPPIEEALKYWIQNPADSMLVSQLERNPELKTFALNNTPWVNNAQSETLRMSRLIGITDRGEAKQTISNLIGKVLALQNSDGSFSWCSGMKGDYFSSSIALGYIGLLADMGYLPENKELVNAIGRLIHYNQKEILRLYESGRKTVPTGSILTYLFAVKNLKNNRNAASGFTDLCSKGLKEIATGWKKLSIYDAATAAIVLDREGDKATARAIIESLRQRAMTSPAEGMWFDNLGSGYNGVSRLNTTARVLEAFAKVNPEDTESIDAIRQYLVLHRRVEDWGSSSSTCAVINAILTTGSDWKPEETLPVFTLDGKPLPIVSNPYTGEALMPLDAEQASGATIMISRESGSTAWGSVMAQYVEKIEDVKAASVQELSISKQIVVVDNSSDGTLLSPASVLKKGQLVRVILTLNTSRDMNYVAVNDQRGACMEPVDRLSSYKYADGISLYQEVRDSATNFFIGFLPKGSHILSYDCRITEDGEFSIGIATVQSQYSPEEVAHSGGAVLEVKGR